MKYRSKLGKIVSFTGRMTKDGFAATDGKRFTFDRGDVYLVGTAARYKDGHWYNSGSAWYWEGDHETYMGELL